MIEAGSSLNFSLASVVRLVRATVVVLLGLALVSCTPPELLTLRSGLDSLRVVVDTMSARNALAYRTLQETQKEVAEQRDILLSTRASTGSTTREVFDQMSRLEAKLEEVMGRFQKVTEREPTRSPVDDGRQIFEQATQDLTQGRYPMALQGFRDYVVRFPQTDLSDNAQYGIGECWFAESQFDSASVEYSRVDSLYPLGDKVPAALYKLALSLEKLGRASEAKRALESLVGRYPLSGESQLARERLGTPRRR